MGGQVVAEHAGAEDDHRLDPVVALPPARHLSRPATGTGSRIRLSPGIDK
jgi:hypothetical protein